MMATVFPQVKIREVRGDIIRASNDNDPIWECVSGGPFADGIGRSSSEAYIAWLRLAAMKDIIGDPR